MAVCQKLDNWSNLSRKLTVKTIPDHFRSNANTRVKYVYGRRCRRYSDLDLEKYCYPMGDPQVYQLGKVLQHDLYGRSDRSNWFRRSENQSWLTFIVAPGQWAGSACVTSQLQMAKSPVGTLTVNDDLLQWETRLLPHYTWDTRHELANTCFIQLAWGDCQAGVMLQNISFVDSPKNVPLNGSKASDITCPVPVDQKFPL